MKQQEEMESYLQDESKMRGWADAISFSESAEDIQACLQACEERGLSVTVQGGLTGLCGGAVPQGGHILNLSKMNRVLGMQAGEEGNEFWLRVEPGVLLEDLQRALMRRKFDTVGWTEESKRVEAQFRKSETSWFFPPDPTETLASIGGMAACNASGAGSFRYGAMREYVQGISVVTQKGTITLRRGDKTQKEFLTEWGTIETVDLENAVTGKNAAGYLLDPDADAVDLFLGSEGTLGVLSELQLRILPKPSHRMGILCFFDEMEPAVEFVRWLRGEQTDRMTEKPQHLPVAIEYFDQNAFQILEGFRELKPELRRFDAVSKQVKTGIYVEYHQQSELQILAQAEQLFEQAAVLGMEEGSEWCAFDESSLEQLKQLRHAVPECVNLQMDLYKTKDARLRKLGTDFAVPDDKLLDCMRMYEQGLDSLGINSVMFGHIGDNHIHVNLLPETWEAYQKGQALIEQWAEMVIAWGGTITAEHGVGRSKQAAFDRMFSERDRKSMKRVKGLLNPGSLLNPGVIFEGNK